MTVKLSDMRPAAEVREEDMRDPEYRREYERTKLANDVALRVLAYRAKQGMTQTELARRLGMRQPNIARLEAGEHEPSLSTLVRLSSVLGIDFSIDIKGGGLKLRKPPRPAPAKKSAQPKGGGSPLLAERQSRRRGTPTRSSVTPAARHTRGIR